MKSKNGKTVKENPGGETAGVQRSAGYAKTHSVASTARGAGYSKNIEEPRPEVDTEFLSDDAASGAIKGNTPEAVRFLQAWAPEGPWVLTSIIVDAGKTNTRTFQRGEEDALTEWVDERQGKQNLYFTVNPTINPITKKASKEDVKSMVALHVDLDPRAGEDFAAEQERTLQVLKEFDPAPTVIIFSGGGHQGFWMLDKEHRTDGDVSRAEELEAYNIQLEVLLGGDHCHNIDRIMRLPGTINVPNERKRSKGREPALARVVDEDWDRVYSLKQFTAAPRVQSNDDPTGGATKVRISGNLPTLNSLDDLPAGVSARVKQLIVQGFDPDEPGRYGSRSEAVFGVLCEMVRADCSDDEMAAVILDPDYAISGHILSQPKPQAYAARQIERARETAHCPQLLEMNARHAVLKRGGRSGGKSGTVVATFGTDEKGRPDVELQTFEDIVKSYQNRFVVTGQNKDGDDIKKPLGKWWLDHKNRREYDGRLTFVPNGPEEINGHYNRWRGFGVEPRAGDWSMLRDHIRDNLAAGDGEADRYIMRWAAWAVQNPDKQAEVALVFVGEKGVGKGMFGWAMKDLFGTHSFYCQAGDLTGRFNAHLAECCLLFADEAVWSGDRVAEARLKSLLTESTLAIERKGVDLAAQDNFLHVIIAANEDWAVPAGIDERRFAVFNVGSGRKEDEVYFTALKRQMMDEGGHAAMLHDLLKMDLGDWHPRRGVPQNAGLMAQKIAGLQGEQRAVFELLWRGITPAVIREGWLSGERAATLTGDNGSVFIATEDLARWARTQRIKLREDNRSLGRALIKANGGRTAVKEKVHTEWVRGCWLPRLPEARAAWCEANRIPFDWEDGAEVEWSIGGGLAPAQGGSSDEPW
ncbi:DUF5906 domain-containing protein [Acuticoccus sp. MNP-M23]|uniref:primase-helicase family protein n=1 Tax=Acuticoccus sp. MNP-M23 TaxID=3072793 RepID=UPI0028157E55|nr:DUF5906 domain-containing protein [Acuticoccus sp. MNP-M23]WMS42292.1 DUF5906 domain-containing protein [Acuticoccus sp. MNP-M23]